MPANGLWQIDLAQGEKRHFPDILSFLRLAVFVRRHYLSTCTCDSRSHHCRMPAPSSISCSVQMREKSLGQSQEQRENLPRRERSLCLCAMAMAGPSGRYCDGTCSAGSQPAGANASRSGSLCDARGKCREDLWNGQNLDANSLLALRCLPEDFHWPMCCFSFKNSALQEQAMDLLGSLYSKGCEP